MLSPSHAAAALPPSPASTQVRDKIKNFAQNAVGSAVPGYPCPPFKVTALGRLRGMAAAGQGGQALIVCLG